MKKPNKNPMQSRKKSIKKKWNPPKKQTPLKPNNPQTQVGCYFSETFFFNHGLNLNKIIQIIWIVSSSVNFQSFSYRTDLCRLRLERTPVTFWPLYCLSKK